MNARYSPHVTSRDASAYGRSSTWCRGPLVVERKRLARRPRRGGANLHDAARLRDPGERIARRDPTRRRLLLPPIRGRERIGAEQVFDVAEDQLLMLLLVGQAKHSARARAVVQTAFEAREHRVVDAPPVVADLVQRRAGQHPARGPLVAGPQRLVVRIEQVSERRRHRLTTDDERLEEPGCVCQVPLCRTRVRHRLHLTVLGRERLTQVLGLPPDLQVPAHQPVHDGPQYSACAGPGAPPALFRGRLWRP